MKQLVLFFAFTLLINFQSEAQLYFPPTFGNWDTLQPSTLGWCPDKIENLYDFLEQTNSKAFILLKDGKIVLEKYFGTFTADSIHEWNSAGKTLVGFTVGVAQENGLFSINDTTSNYLGTGWTSLTPSQEEKITIKHQLSMTTGMDDMSNSDCTDPGCLTYVADAGTRWSYHNAPYTLLSSVIEQASGQTMNAYVNANVAAPIGMAGLFINAGYNKVYVSKPRSMARFGLLLLANGDWNGTSILGDQTYLNEMRTSSQTINLSYGYLTWLNGQSSFMVPQTQFVFNGSAVPSAPADMYAALGKNSQIINVVPSQNLVFIRMGDGDGVSLVSNQYNDSIWVRLNDLSCTNSISDHAKIDVSVIPNPSKGSFQLTGDIDYSTLRIVSIIGDSVPFSRNGKQIEIASKGIYFVQFEKDNERKSIKVIIE